MFVEAEGWPKRRCFVKNFLERCAICEVTVGQIGAK